MSQSFPMQPEECSHEHLIPAATMNDETHVPRHFTQCRDCGEDMTLLPAFLRARAEEAKGQANEAIDERRRVSIRGEEPDYGPPIAWPDLGTPACLVGPEFVLCEAAAKIALVDEYEDFLTVATTDDRTEQRCTLHFALEHLAAAYRDHENYRPEWAPYEEQP